MGEDMPERHMYIGSSRLLCEVLEDMRTCDKTKSYGCLPGLIEEAQVLGNRMESGLENVRKIKQIEEQKSKYKKEIRELEAKLINLDSAIKEAEEKINNLVENKTNPCIISACNNKRELNSNFCKKHIENLIKKLDIKA